MVVEYNGGVIFGVDFCIIIGELMEFVIVFFEIYVSKVFMMIVEFVF